jgi:hypothetical protein
MWVIRWTICDVLSPQVFLWPIALIVLVAMGAVLVQFNPTIFVLGLYF